MVYSVYLPANRKAIMRPQDVVFRVLLVIIGGVSVYVSLNVAAGGLHTLGWQGSGDYFTVTDDAAYALRDNHARFYGGLFLALGAFLLLAATNPQRYRGGLLLAFVLVFVGGLARLTQMQPEVVFGPSNLLSAITELVVMPLLFVWLWRARPTPKSASGVPSGDPVEPVA
jgi:hypothetical protein